jgi:anti-sigma factor RsiW
MNCKSVEDLLWGLCEGSLGEGSARSVEEHLAVCRRCSHARDRVQSSLAAMRGVGEIEPSADFQARLWQRIDAWETRRRPFWVAVWAGFIARNRRLVVTSGVAFAVALLGGLYAMKTMIGRRSHGSCFSFSCPE